VPKHRLWVTCAPHLYDWVLSNNMASLHRIGITPDSPVSGIWTANGVAFALRVSVSQTGWFGAGPKSESVCQPAVEASCVCVDCPLQCDLRIKPGPAVLTRAGFGGPASRMCTTPTKQDLAQAVEKLES
jgi:hypothetical protein